MWRPLPSFFPPHHWVLILFFFFSSFPISEAFDSVLLLNSSWNSSISKSSSSLPSSFPGRVLAKSGRGTAHQRLAAISRGPHVSNSGQPWLQTGTLKQATTHPVIPVSTLVSGIDNRPIHLGPLKLAWHFKGEDREPGQPDTACKRGELKKGGIGGWGKGLFGMWRNRICFGEWPRTLWNYVQIQGIWHGIIVRILNMFCTLSCYPCDFFFFFAQVWVIYN